MNNYLHLLKRILEEGEDRQDRTGVGTKALFGEQLKFDLTKGFPLVTTKRVHMASVIYELLWMLSGSTNVKDLNKNGVTIWDEWSRPDGDLGPLYGFQWRNATKFTPSTSVVRQTDEKSVTLTYTPVDQIAVLIEGIKTNPHSRRHIVNSWCVADLSEMALTPCCALFQMFVHSDNTGLSCQLYQRSADIFLGTPFNIASYALLTMLVAQMCGLEARNLTISYGDVHLYHNHIEQAKEQLSREPKPLPTMDINPSVSNISNFCREDFQLLNYVSHPAIKGDVAV